MESPRQAKKEVEWGRGGGNHLGTRDHYTVVEQTKKKRV